MEFEFAGPSTKVQFGRMTRRDALRSLAAMSGGITAAPFVFPLSSLAQSTADDSNVSAETIAIPAGSVQIQAYLAKPKAQGKLPAVIVVHDSRGLTDFYREAARKFAAEGYLALAPDLLSRAGGTSAVKPEELGDTLNAIAPMSTLGDLLVSMNTLQRRPDVDADKVAAVGFGWGGWRAFMMAVQESDLKRVVVYCGAPPEYGLEKIDASVLAHYSKYDNRTTGNAVLIAEKMKAAGKKFQYHVYDKTERGFFDAASPDYNADAAKLAWQRTLDFLKG